MKQDNQEIYYKDAGVHFEVGLKSGALAAAHVHNSEYQVEVLLKGTSKDLHARGSELLTPGKIDLFHPGEPHLIDYRDTDSFFFFVTKDFLTDVFEEMDLRFDANSFSSGKESALLLPLETARMEIQSLASLHKALADGSEVDEVLAEYRQEKVLDLLRVVLRSITPKGFNERGILTSAYHFTLVQRAKQWIEENYHCDDLNLKQLAQQSRLSIFHFSRVFRRYVGVSPYKFLAETRLRHAKRMIKKTRKDLTEIAVAVGFRSTKQLRYHLKKDLGINPSQLRD